MVDEGAKDEGKKLKAWKGTGPQLEWVTSIECVSAAGLALPPLVIFKAVFFNSQYLPVAVLNLVVDWQWTTSNTGWSNDTLAYERITRVFEPVTATAEPNRWSWQSCQSTLYCFLHCPLD